MTDCKDFVKNYIFFIILLITIISIIIILTKPKWVRMLNKPIFYKDNGLSRKNCMQMTSASDLSKGSKCEQNLKKSVQD